MLTPLAQHTTAAANTAQTPGKAGQKAAPEGGAHTPANSTEAAKTPNTPEYRQVQELKARDREVRQHEQAHIAAGGQYVKGGATYSYQKGPDGRSYAVGGEVQIDTSSIPDDPEATLQKMQVVQRAAMAPAEPSAQDRAVAAQAAQTAAQARMELQTLRQQGEEGQAAAAYQETEEDPASALLNISA